MLGGCLTKKAFLQHIASCKIKNDLMISLYDLIKEYRKKDSLNQYISVSKNGV